MTGWLTGWGRPVPSDGPAGGHLPGTDHGMPGMMSDADLAGWRARPVGTSTAGSSP